MKRLASLALLSLLMIAAPITATTASAKTCRGSDIARAWCRGKKDLSNNDPTRGPRKAGKGIENAGTALSSLSDTAQRLATALLKAVTSLEKYGHPVMITLWGLCALVILRVVLMVQTVWQRLIRPV